MIKSSKVCAVIVKKSVVALLDVTVSPMMLPSTVFDGKILQFGHSLGLTWRTVY